MDNKTAMYYDKLNEKKVQCLLCPHHCMIVPGKRGICGVRENKEGELYGISYGEITSISLDPIEKKPLARFYPGSMILSAGSFGCNFRCGFCQNSSISMDRPDTINISPRELIIKAQELIPYHNIGLAFTYNEPFISFEYVLDCFKLSKKAGLKNVLVTNGYVSEAPLKELLPYIDAMNIDLKSFNDEFYKKICGGLSENVKDTIKLAAASSHVEITTLIIPGMNDSKKEMGELSEWLSSISPDIPLHISRFFPRYNMKDKPATPAETILTLAAIARKFLNYVYTGNM